VSEVHVDFVTVISAVIPSCSLTGGTGYKCILIDQGGYLITHPSFLQNSGEESLWLGDMEPTLAKRLISDGVLQPYNTTDWTNSQTCAIFRVQTNISAYVSTTTDCGTYWFAPIPGNTSNTFLVGYSGITCSNGNTAVTLPTCTPFDDNICQPVVGPRQIIFCPDFILTSQQLASLRNATYCNTGNADTTNLFTGEFGKGYSMQTNFYLLLVLVGIFLLF